MKKRHFSPILLLFLVFLLLQSGVQTTFAASDGALETAVQPGELLIPGGNAFGIKLFTKGVVVIGVTDVQTASGLTAPAADAGLEVGDVIVEIDGHEVNTAEETKALIGACEGRSLSVVYERGGERVSTVLTPQLDAAENEDRGGVWVRDSTAGIGTVTYYDPATGAFGALGHGITDGDTMALMPFGSGSILPSTVKAVKKGSSGSAGELRGNFDLSGDLGPLCANTDCGIFGTLSQPKPGEAVQTAPASAVTTGAAEILSNVDGEQVQRFSIRIDRVDPDAKNGRNLLITVTDEALLAKTGGIVQGMSGSPILQNGKLVGAVTHVLVNDPTMGYGVLIENMLEMAK